MIKNRIEKFWARIKKTENIVDCWPWDKTDFSGNYPYVVCRSTGRRTPMPAHRLVFFLHNGGFPKDNKKVLHRCGNRFCCNPHHLYAGTTKENSADSKRHGTMRVPEPRRGEKHHNAKLTLAVVVLARKVYPLLSRGQKSTFAELCGISSVHMRRLMRGESWSHPT